MFFQILISGTSDLTTLSFPEGNSERASTVLVSHRKCLRLPLRDMHVLCRSLFLLNQIPQGMPCGKNLATVANDLP
jgi:hypothetical protein